MIVDMNKIIRDIVIQLNFYKSKNASRDRILAGFIGIVCVFLVYYDFTNFRKDPYPFDNLVFLDALLLVIPMIWIVEQEGIVQYKSYSNKELATLIRSRVIPPFLVLTLVQLLIMYLLNTSNSLVNYNFKTDIAQFGVVYLIISLVIFNALMTVYITLLTVSYGNYLRIPVSNLGIYNHRIEELGIDRKTYKKMTNALIMDTKSAFMMIIALIFFYVCYYFPLSYYQNQGYANTPNIKGYFDSITLILPYWFLTINIISLVLIYRFWKKIPSALKNLSPKYYTLPDQLKEYLRTI